MPQTKDVSTAPAQDDFVWFLYVLTRGGKPFKIFSDEDEAIEFKEMYSLDDSNTTYDIVAVDSSMLHLTPPIGTQVIGSQSGRKLIYGPSLGEGGGVIDWHEVTG